MQMLQLALAAATPKSTLCLTDPCSLRRSYARHNFQQPVSLLHSSSNALAPADSQAQKRAVMASLLSPVGASRGDDYARLLASPAALLPSPLSQGLFVQPAVQEGRLCFDVLLAEHDSNESSAGVAALEGMAVEDAHFLNSSQSLTARNSLWAAVLASQGSGRPGDARGQSLRNKASPGAGNNVAAVAQHPTSPLILDFCSC